MVSRAASVLPQGRHSLDYPRTPPLSSQSSLDRRASLDNLAPLKAIWGQNPSVSSEALSYGQMPNGVQAQGLQKLPDMAAELDTPFAHLNLQGLTGQSYTPFPAHQLDSRVSSLSLEDGMNLQSLTSTILKILLRLPFLQIIAPFDNVANA